jgi:hypothetical protein
MHEDDLGLLDRVVQGSFLSHASLDHPHDEAMVRGRWRSIGRFNFGMTLWVTRKLPAAIPRGYGLVAYRGSAVDAAAVIVRTGNSYSVARRATGEGLLGTDVDYMNLVGLTHEHRVRFVTENPHLIS